MTAPHPKAPPQDTTASEKAVAETLRLRPDPPRVLRLSRKAILLASTVGSLSLGAILLVALQDGRSRDDAPEQVATGHAETAEGLSSLPRDYGDIPALGPPLPGDLGRPILGAMERGEPIHAPALPGPAMPGVDPEEQLRLKEGEAARLSPLFAEAATSARGAAVVPGLAMAPGGTMFPGGTAGEPDDTANREAFLDRGSTDPDVSPERLAAPPSPYILQAGTMIPAALVTGLRSDLPGQIVAQVTANVYDSPSGRYLLIPQGARLLGEYDSRTTPGQNRLLLVWTRLILPDGRSISLGRAHGTDGTGASGLKDRVDRHWDRVLLAAGVATLLNLGLEQDSESEDDVARAIRDAAQNTIGRTADGIVEREIAIPPTLTIRPGFPVRVMVTADLVLEPLGVVP
jgi:type IV secretion system protein TrbI